MKNYEKANLVIELLIKYFERYFPDMKEYYSVLYNYNEKEDVQYYDYDWFEEFSIVIENDKYVLDISPYCINYVQITSPSELFNLLKFNEVMEKCYANKKNTWDYTIDYLQKRLGETP